MNEVKGRYLELVDESKNMIIFSAAIPSLEKEAFLKMWGTVGEMLYDKQDGNRFDSYRIRLSGIQLF
jgi:hypothetical protein